MWWVGLFCALCGCNQILGIDPSILVDARQFDGPLDAPYACPQIGAAPQFEPVFHQVTTRSCTDFSFSTAANRTMALCTDDGGGIAEGTIDSDDLKAAMGFEPIGLATFEQARLTPEGDEVYIKVREDFTTKLSVYSRDATGWTLREDLAISTAGGDFLASVTRAPARRLFIADPSILHEYRSDDAGAWTEVGSYTLTNLGLTTMFAPRVTGDGLRMVVTGRSGASPNEGIYFADRANVASRFGMAVRLSNLPSAIYASLADDCSRLYFSALDTVFYVRQP